MHSIRIVRQVLLTGMVCLMSVTTFGASPSERAIGWLGQWMDQFHTNVYVYLDASSAANHFADRGRMPPEEDGSSVLTMDEACTNNPYSGLTCIEANFLANGNNWGGWYFMNGALTNGEVLPHPNWGTNANAGVNLQGASCLTFRARGKNGGERVEFFACGVGWDEHNNPNPDCPFRDSSPKVSLGYVTLANAWTEYTIDLSSRDLSYVLGGFGWVSSSNQNFGQNITFYLDDIRYDLSHLDQPRFLLSYQTINSTNDFDLVMRNVAYLYDNAVACMAFLANDQTNRALTIADAMVYALDHDRYFNDGRLRNAYQAGDLILPPGWVTNDKTNTVRMAGWYSAGRTTWFEDRTQAGTLAGNQAWAMLALLYCYEATGRTHSNYLAAATRMGDWLETFCRDTRGAGGYTGGFEGWEPSPVVQLYKSTEHNADILAAFSWLFRLTGDAKWDARATHARLFLQSMYDSSTGRFWTGTETNGVTTNTYPVPLDVQFWVPQAMGADGTNYWQGMNYAEAHMKVEGGYDFDEDGDGVWREGTGIAADGYGSVGQTGKQQDILKYLASCQDASGGFHAADHDGLTTGIYLSDGKPWLYHHRLHVAPTAWFLIAESGLNPFAGTKTWNYTVTNDTITITGYAGLGRGFDIPGTINSLPVTRIGNSAFNSCTNLTRVTIPSSVTNIGASAFSACSDLAAVYFAGNAPAVGANAFQNASHATVYYLPGKTGWGSTFGGCATVCWNPQATNAANFGVCSNRFGFAITGTAGIGLVVEACTNLVNPFWTSVSNITLATGSEYFSDAQWTNRPAGFYRFRAP